MVYDKKISELLGNALALGEAVPESAEYPEKFKTNCAGMTVELKLDEKTGRRVAQTLVPDPTIDGEYTAAWKGYAPGKFLCRDYAKNVRDKAGKTPYYVARARVDGVPVKALLRRLFELEEKRLPDAEREDLKRFADVSDGTHEYALVKVCNEDISGETWLSASSKKSPNALKGRPIDKVDGIRPADGGKSATQEEDSDEEEALKFSPLV